MTNWVQAEEVSTRSFVGATVAVPPLVSVCTVTAVCTAGYSGAGGSAAVSLAAWVMSLCGWTFGFLLRIGSC